MATRGFQGFRVAEQISKEALDKALEKMGPTIDGHYIYWTGNNYNFRRPSLRSNALRCLSEKKRPISLKAWIKRASHCAGEGIGYDPQRVREGLYLHRNSKPCVYFELKKDAKGNFVSVNHVPYPDGFAKPLKPGDIVVAATGETVAKQLPKGKARIQALPSQANGSNEPSSPPADLEIDPASGPQA